MCLAIDSSQMIEERDARAATKFRWLCDRVVVLDRSTPGTMIITVMLDADTSNGFLDAAIDEIREAKTFK